MIFFAFWPSFLNFGLAGWLAAAAVPIVIHLLSRRRRKEMNWAAMRFLIEAVKKNSRRLLIEQWILLAIRTLIIVCVVLAMMQPYWDQGIGAPAVGGRRAHKLIVLDGSFSMQYRPGDKSLWDEARDVAREIVENGSEGDGFTVLLMSDPPREVIRTPAFAASEVSRELAALDAPDGTASVSTTLQKIEEMLVRGERDAPQLEAQEIYFVSDLGRATWTRETLSEEVLAKFKKRGESAGVYVIDLGRVGSDNLAVVGMKSLQHPATTAEDVVFEAQLANFGRQTRMQQRATWLVDGQIAGEQLVDLEPQATRTVSLAHRFRTGGEHSVEMRLAPDSLDLDNHRWLAATVHDSLDVLLVNGKWTGDPFQGAAEYLRIALSPSAKRPGVVRPEVVTENKLVEIENLDKYACVFLCNIGLIGEAEATRLEGYVERGGALVVFLGDQVVPESYNAWLAGTEPRGQKLLPATIGPLVERRPDQPAPTLNPLEYAHPIVQVFRGNELAGLGQTPINAYYRLQPVEGGPGKVALAVGPGDPFLIEAPYGRGRVALAATGVDAVWSDLPKVISFVPLMHELLRFMLPDDSTRRNVLVGQPLQATLPPEASTTSVEVFAPAARPASDPATPRESSGGQRVELLKLPSGVGLSYPDTTNAGVYRIAYGAPTNRDELAAANVDPVESDLAKLERSELEQEVFKGVRFHYHTQRPDSTSPVVSQLPRRGEWHRVLLYAALGLLLVEVFAAWKLGYHST